jgi:hypothetical protein
MMCEECDARIRTDLAKAANKASDGPDRCLDCHMKEGSA